MDTEVIDTKTQYLTFCLKNNLYAIKISAVREIVDVTEVIPVPKIPEFMKGVINLRGSVVPIMDLRLKLGFQACDITKDSCIIIIEFCINDENLTFGTLVDSVHSVISLENNSIEPPPRFGLQFQSDFLLGVGQFGKGLLFILNMENILSSDELLSLEEIDENNGTVQSVASNNRNQLTSTS